MGNGTGCRCRGSVWLTLTRPSLPTTILRPSKWPLVNRTVFLIILVAIPSNRTSPVTMFGRINRGKSYLVGKQLVITGTNLTMVAPKPAGKMLIITGTT